MESDGDWRIGSQGQGMHWVDTPEVAVAAKWAASVVDASRNKDRYIVAVAGIPGSGKSTFTRRLVECINHGRETRLAVVIAMDGFHLSKSALHAMENSQHAHERRGAPFTFDSVGFVNAVRSIATQHQDSVLEVRLPSFDHSLGDPVMDNVSVLQSDCIVVIEGNYVLARDPPWNAIPAHLAHECWFIDCPIPMARQRVMNRHLEAGIEQSRAAAERRTDNNDMLNAHWIMDNLTSHPFTRIKEWNAVIG